jgi:hypothetical protein
LGDLGDFVAATEEYALLITLKRAQSGIWRPAVLPTRPTAAIDLA